MTPISFRRIGRTNASEAVQEQLVSLIKSGELKVGEKLPPDAAFHVALAEATGNQVQARLVEHLRDLLVEQSLVIVAIEGRIAQANSEHRSIYEAVAAGDEGRAERAMSTHLLNVYSI